MRAESAPASRYFSALPSLVLLSGFGTSFTLYFLTLTLTTIIVITIIIINRVEMPLTDPNSILLNTKKKCFQATFSLNLRDKKRKAGALATHETEALYLQIKPLNSAAEIIAAIDEFKTSKDPQGATLERQDHYRQQFVNVNENKVA